MIAGNGGPLSEADLRTAETIDRLHADLVARGLDDNAICAEMAALAPGAFWTLRNRLSEAEFEALCLLYPGLAEYGETIRRWVYQAMGWMLRRP